MPKSNVGWLVILSVLSGFAGGYLSNHFPSLVPASYAQDSDQQLITAQEFQLVDNNGKSITRWTNCEGSPCMNFYDAAGNVRLQMGLYSDGIPFVGLFDKQFQAKALLRLFGDNETPVLVMKNNGQDRLIMGLDQTSSTNPFLATFDEAGQKHMQFGNY